MSSPRALASTSMSAASTCRTFQTLTRLADVLKMPVPYFYCDDPDLAELIAKFGYVLLQQKKFREAAPVFERTLNSGFLPADRVDDRTKTVAQLYSTLGRKWLEKHPNDIDVRVLLGQSYYLLNDFTNAATTMTTVVNQAERTGQTPKEEWLQIILTSHFTLNNQEGRAEGLKKMVRYHPNAEYWGNPLDLYRRSDPSDRITLGYYRLMDEVGVLEDKDDYVEMAQLAMDANVPGEQRIVEKGFKNGTLKSTNTTEQAATTGSWRPRRREQQRMSHRSMSSRAKPARRRKISPTWHSDRRT